MQFRPCIDIHDGRVKQIVGSTLNDKTGRADENFVSGENAAHFAELYKKYGLKGGHVIILNARGTAMYDASKKEALEALGAFEGGMMAGGGIDDENAGDFIEAGASHIIVTSFVFRGGRIDRDNLYRIKSAVGKDRLCLDLSCRKRDGRYFIVTDRWQKFTDEELNEEILNTLSFHCGEFLVHAADAEGKRNGIEEEVIEILRTSPIPVTYAGGIRNAGDMRLIKRLGQGRVNATVGSALKIFGGEIDLKDIIGVE
ncbi:MAG: phosphoribosylformimino-5-aminoimidazole carboxamide ribotide isomerase [Lachnospiraceae bacterium]|nr:phosphoribosylformimino-5-aminoimidazole carboxamide ribotide isomerase [Lachnospiraceae bacterium]